MVNPANGAEFIKAINKKSSVRIRTLLFLLVEIPDFRNLQDFGNLHSIQHFFQHLLVCFFIKNSSDRNAETRNGMAMDMAFAGF